MASGKYNRIKGHVFERSIAALFRECGWTKAARNLREVQAHHAVRHHDLENTAPFAVQCKATETQHSDMRLLDGVKLDPKSGFVFPILVRKRNGYQPTVTMKVEDVVELCNSISHEARLPEDTMLVTLSMPHFTELLKALKKAGLYPKNS